MFELKNKVALITGAGANIGEGVAHVLAKQGATVFVNDLDLDRAQAVVEDIRNAGGDAQASAFDVTDRASVDEAVAQILVAKKKIDILVNNAGHAISHGIPFADTPPEVWPKVVDLNIYGLFNCVHAVLPSMINQKGGRIIIHTSGAGQTGLDIGVSTYGATKAAQIGLMKHLAMENAQHGITCNAISIGIVLKDPSAVEGLASSIPMGRVGTPQDIGALAAYLSSDEAAWITGQTIGANGGSLMA